MDQVSEELETAMSGLLSEHAEEYNSVNRVINQLLHIWKLAETISPVVALPVEQLLSAVSTRKLVTSAELDQTMALVREARVDHEQIAAGLLDVETSTTH